MGTFLRNLSTCAPAQINGHLQPWQEYRAFQQHGVELSNGVPDRIGNGLV